MVEEKKPDALGQHNIGQRQDEKTKFKDTAAPARPPLGKIKTDEEARLAAEIEKLRG